MFLFEDSNKKGVDKQRGLAASTLYNWCQSTTYRQDYFRLVVPNASSYR
jgi:hypothetical protein